MGRAPTSGNCHTCRLRRVRCDKARPACQRCIKGGYECQGYEAILRMQNHAVVAGASPGSSRLGKIQEVSSYPEGPPDDDDGDPSSPAKRVIKRPRKTPEKSTPSDSSSSRGSAPSSSDSDARSRSPSPPTELGLAAFVDDLSFSYFFQSYGWINLHSILLQDSTLRGQLTEEGMTHDSLRALAYGVFGRDQHIQSLQETAQRLYGTAVRTLRSKLSLASKDELALLVKPIAIMGSYAITVENDLRFTHHKGLAQILQHCGPEYFQDPSLLPILESCRLTLIANSMIRRQATFLARPEWKSVPWAKNPHLKTPMSKLLDIMAEVPGLVQSAFGIMADRTAWHLSNFTATISETPSTVPALQARVQLLDLALQAWLAEWQGLKPLLAPSILAWSFHRVSDDAYRPRIAGLHGPDIFDANVLLDGPGVSAAATAAAPPEAPCPVLGDEDASAAFVAMQDVALYTTARVWTSRLARYLASAATDPASIAFFTAPFHTGCKCCSLPPSRCETVPPATPPGGVSADMSWNVAACRVAVAPVRVMTAAAAAAAAATAAVEDGGGSSGGGGATMPVSAGGATTTLVPGDVRFAAQLRILRWLCDRLPASRPHVLGTLAAIGLGHCAHDVRPADGIREVADTVAGVLDKTRFEGAENILLKSYRPVMV